MNLISLDAIDVERWKRIESLFDAALDLRPDELSTFLDRACAKSPELRREVEELIEADRRAERFLAIPAAVLLGPLAEGTGPMPRPDSPPQRLGRYVVLGELGRGGMGIVYEGRDEALDRRVAIKSLPPEVASNPEWLARFLGEAKLLGTLHHPNIAAIHGVEQAHGARYLILERIEGSTLSERLRQGPLPLAEAVDVCAQIASALAAAHAHGIIHRDLKPGNVMVTPAGLVKVLDFGLAMHVSGIGPRSSAASSSPPLAGPMARVGTPGYMSPEQIQGRPQDARTDLFAFGALLYQCLTGARAFSGASPHEVLASTLETAADPARLPRETPASLRALIARTLEKDSSRRLADAGEAAAVLSGLQASSGTAPHAPAIGPGPAWLPETATPFVGRDEEIAACLELFARTRLVTLTGGGGCGKTRLAVEVAGAAVLADERWFADLAPASDAPAVVAAVAAATGVRETREAGLVEVLAARLAERTGLLVLDDCDKVLGACSALSSRLLDRCTGLRILATSREWLGAPGEQTYRVPPLSLPDPEWTPTRDRVGSTESVRLFVACAGTARTGFELTDANAGMVAGICRGLDGMPLAIEVTAALLRVQSLEDIARDLERRLEASTDSTGFDHDALTAAIRLSHDRLAEDERRFFRALSVFTGGWSLEAAAAVCGVDGDEFVGLDLLTRLVDKSLVVIQRSHRIEPRYRFLEPVRHYAANRRDAAREAAALRTRHLDWFLAAAERAAPSLLSGSDQARCLASLEADHPNLLAAFVACEHEEEGAEKALRLAGAVWLFWYVRGHFARGRAALAQAMALPGAQAPTAARAQALFAAGGLALYQGDYVEGRRLSQSAHELYGSLGDRLGVARSLSHLGMCESGEGRYAEAGRCTQEAVAIFREARDPRRLSAALNNLGVLQRQQGDYAAALVSHEEALGLLRRADDRDGTIATLVNLGLASVRLGRVEAARDWVDEALAHAKDLRARRAGSSALQVAAEVLLERHAPEEAARVVGAAQALRSSIAISADPWWRRAQDDLGQRLRRRLKEARFDRLVAEGGELTFEQAIDRARHAFAEGRAGSDRAGLETTTAESPSRTREETHEPQ